MFFPFFLFDPNPMHRDMDFWTEVRRDLFVEGISKRAACRRFGMSFHTIQKIAELEDTVETLTTENAFLKKNSGNSSKPPSSDIVKPPRQKKKNRKRKIVGQKGHKQHLRTPFTEDQIDEVINLTLDACPKCNGKLTPSGDR